MTDSNAITWLENLRRKKCQALEALEAVDPERFLFLLTSAQQETAAIDHALDRIRQFDRAIEREADGMKALAMLHRIEKELDAVPDAIRIREGGGPEDLAASVAVTISKLRSR